jgi:peptidoglycan/xylan/chitin deacetylase (PgdA/CDA1 family)
LTFDDGPGKLTSDVLDLLRAHEAQATFYVCGSQIGGHEAILRRILGEGHELGNHGWHHECLAGRPLASHHSMRRTNRRLRAVTGRCPRLFRAPYGEDSLGVTCAARLLGMTTVRWDVDPRDWENPGPDVIYANVLAPLRGGSIVLLHDQPRGSPQTAAALATLLPELKSRNYELVTVSKLLR